MIFYYTPLRSQSSDSIYMGSICDSVMKYFLVGDYSKAMENLKKSSAFGESFDQLQTTVPLTMSKAISHYGKAVSYKFIKEYQIADAVKEFFYLLMFEKYFLKFDFTWYKSTKGWTIVNFNFDEKLTEILN